MQSEQPERRASAESAETGNTGQSDEQPQNGKSVDRTSVVVARPGAFLTLVILSCFGAGYAIYWLLRTMHI